MKTEKEIKKLFKEAMTKVSEEDLDWLISNELTAEEKELVLSKLSTERKQNIIENLIYEL